MFWIRLRSSILIVAGAFVILWFGGAVTTAGICLVALLALFEINRALNIEKSVPAILSYILTAGFYVLLYLEPEFQSMLLVTAYMMTLLAVYVFCYPRYHFSQICGAFFAMFYVSVMLSYVVRIRNTGNGILVMLLFISAWGCDTCAYCAGMLFGRHKVTPLLSPKKTIEGYIGGLAGATALGALFGFICGHFITGLFDYTAAALGCALVCLAGAVGSVIGDLAASAIKRDCKIKDFGTLLPGHGGILDRFDSVIFVAPIIYVVITLLTA